MCIKRRDMDGCGLSECEYVKRWSEEGDVKRNEG